MTDKEKLDEMLKNNPVLVEAAARIADNAKTNVPMLEGQEPEPASIFAHYDDSDDVNATVKLMASEVDGYRTVYVTIQIDGKKKPVSFYIEDEEIGLQQFTDIFSWLSAGKGAW